jgi:predicted kinase
MAQSVLEQMSEQIDETAHKASRAASAVADAFEDGVTTARRVVKRGGQVVTDAFDDSKRRVQRNPIEAVAATFAAGIATGAAISWVLRRKSR